MGKHVSISPNEAADRLAIRAFVEAYAHCSDRRDAKGQMSLFAADTDFVVYMIAKGPAPSEEMHSREALAPVFAELRTITLDYTVEFARVLRAISPEAAFSFLSGKGADQSGRSPMAFARGMGDAENGLLAPGFPRLYIFRPAYIYPVEPRKESNFSYRLLRASYPRFRCCSRTR